MKKRFAIVLVLALGLLLASCGSEGQNAPAQPADSAGSEGSAAAAEQDTSAASEEQGQPEDVMLSVGDTAQGEVCSVTVDSVEFVNAIEGGLHFHMWSPAERENYQDVTAEAGYSIVKIAYHFDYTGKESGRFTLGVQLDYDDGYTFTTDGSHLIPEPESGVGFEKTYAFPMAQSFEVEDPLAYSGEDAVAYIVVNDVVLTDTEKPLIMNMSIPSAPDTMEPDPVIDGGYIYTPSDPVTFTYDLRTVEFDLSSKTEAGDGAESGRMENTGKLIGPNPHNPSLNEKFGDNSWDVKYGDDPVRDLVFFREDIDLTEYIGEEITFSYLYEDNHCVDAYIVE